jgi:RNA polymerase sigma factor (TIGR02999 family)
MTDGQSDVTKLLNAARAGARDAEAEVFDLLYRELKRLAASYLRKERPEHTLQPTALVHEAYLRLLREQMPWANRGHFFGLAARAMRQILVEHARKIDTETRGRGYQKLSLDELFVEPAARTPPLLEVDEALTRLAALDPRQARIVELRVFAGLSIEETAEALGLGPRTINRDWKIAKAWLRRELRHR